MINKIKEIRNLAVFQNFEWNRSVFDNEKNIKEFDQINILYGRNYSGKTTLSRILRAAETGAISDKYENPVFTLLFNDNSEISTDNLKGHDKTIRVFNEDFVRDNLKFIANPDENIESFAILGIDNLRIENEIKMLETTIGSNQEGEESGLYLQLRQITENLNKEKMNYKSRNDQLTDQLNTKATNRKTGIKYNTEKFGDQNYNIRKLETDIRTVIAPSYKALNRNEANELEKLLAENVKDDILPINKPSLTISDLNISVKSLVTQRISETDKIVELVKDATMNRWVKEGKLLHQSKRKYCAFCNNEISVNRWIELEKHFDEKSEKLEISIDQRIREIQNKIDLVANCFNPEINSFYIKFHSDFRRIKNIYQKLSDKYIQELISLKIQLENRKKDILNTKPFKKAIDYSNRIECIFNIYENLRLASNKFSKSLKTEQVKSKEILRLKEVSDFITTINYSSEKTEIEKLKTNVDKLTKNRNIILNEIYEKNEIIENKKRDLIDETKGAERVNELLNNFFGYNILSLKAVEYLLEEEKPKKKFRFEVNRDGKKAYHLSEGECSLIAYSYFIAKLDDITTKEVKPIIWIDDPVSSLDANHVFFVYSILSFEIVHKNRFEQLFISTHNLDFLKYLKRLTGSFLNHNGKKQEYSKSYYILSREDKNTTICSMPNYLKKYITEFNYLFNQIYQCSKISAIDDTNYTSFYNFGNNARKFLEIYLYYKFPDNSDEMAKLKKFFGGEIIPTIFTNRINNEYSHLSAAFERGATPIEVPEMNLVAKLIIKRIKEIDKEQYKSLVQSIGESIT